MDSLTLLIESFEKGSFHKEIIFNITTNEKLEMRNIRLLKFNKMKPMQSIGNDQNKLGKRRDTNPSHYIVEWN